MENTIKYSKESELIDALRSGDQAAFRYLVEKYQDKVKRTSKGFIHSDYDAEEITQEVFIEVYKSIEKFRKESELSTWIYRIAVNKSLNFLRSATKRRIFSFFDFSESGVTKLENNTLASSEYNADENMINSEINMAVNKALDSLPDNQRTAFILSKYEDLAYSEIADVMNVSIPSVESLLFRAKQNLQKKLFIFYKKNML